MTKIIVLLALVLMLLHVIRPFGVPGLTRRHDFWKIAIAMIAAMLIAAVIRD